MVLAAIVALGGEGTVLVRCAAALVGVVTLVQYRRTWRHQGVQTGAEGILVIGNGVLRARRFVAWRDISTFTAPIGCQSRLTSHLFSRVEMLSLLSAGATRGIEIGFGFRPVYEVTDADAELGLLDAWKLKRVAAEVILAL